MKHYRIYIVFTFLILLGFSSCKTRKYTQKNSIEVRGVNPNTKEMSFSSKAKVLKVLSKHQDSWTAMKVDWKAHLRYKDAVLSSKVRMEVARNKGLYLSVRPFPFIELARFWFLPKRVYIVNMMDKSYVELNYEDLSQELGVALNYTQIEGLLMGQAVRLGHKHSHKLKALDYSKSCVGVSLVDRQKEYIVNYAFSFDLELSSVGVMKRSEMLTIDDVDVNHDFYSVFYKRPVYEANQGLRMPKEEIFYFNKEQTKSLNLVLRSAEALNRAKGLHLKPKIKGSYRKMDFQEMKFFVKHLLSKVK